MSASIDVADTMAAMLKTREAFPTIFAKATKDLKPLLTAHYKHKDMSLARLRTNREALGELNFRRSLETIEAAACAATLKRIDPHMKALDGQAITQRLVDLAEGRVEPAPRPTPAPRTARKLATPKAPAEPKPPKPKVETKARASASKAKETGGKPRKSAGRGTLKETGEPA